MSTTATNSTKVKVGIAVLVVGLLGVLGFVLGAWNQNLVAVLLSLVIPFILRSMRGKKFSIGEIVEMLVFGILLWNHMVAAIILLFILKVLFSKLRK